MAFFASNKLPWSFTPTLCLPMSDVSYDPFGQNSVDLLEETVRGSFGRITLYCKYDCCGDSKNAACCTEEQTVDPDGMETYKLVSLIAAGAAGLCMLTVALLYIIKKSMKKRRLIRDINSINKMNNMKDITRVKASKYHKNNMGGYNRHNKISTQKEGPLFKKTKRPITPVAIGGPIQKPPLPDVAITANEFRPMNNAPNEFRPMNNAPVMNSFMPHIQLQDTAPPPPPVIARPIPPAASYEDVLFNNFSFSTGPKLPPLSGTGSIYPE